VTIGFFRETREKVALRRREGCLAVEMEAAAMFAVARYRGVELAQILYAGDNLHAAEWEHRGWHENWTVCAVLVAFAAEACLKL
jgi:uridine phosphorylase